jgi:hypothetical protein
LAQGIELNDSMQLSSIASKVEYIKLESTSKMLIYRPEQLEMCNNEIFILDRKTSSVVRCTKEGKYLNHIGKYGDGIGQFKELGGFDLTKNKEIFIYNRVRGGQILQYNFNGEFVSIVGRNTGFLIRFYKDHFYNYYLGPQLNFENNFHFGVFDTTGAIIKRFYPVNKKLLINTTKEPVINSQLYDYDDGLSFWEGRSDTVYLIENKFTLLPKLHFDLGKYKIPNSLLANGELYKNNISKFGHILKFIESKRLVFIELAINRRMKHIVASKSSGKSYSILNNTINFENDIDYGPNFWPDGILNDGRLYGILDINSLKESMSHNLANGKDKFSESYFGKLLAVSSIDDNPIIMIVTLKTEATFPLN